ncbi:hypothetical protein [Mucilaginibacter aquatilis]|uniref:Uncharacterized protein n=1 Tax=Mucilaginibacter aquatilis TaxID=1517760 RepID=A0A6I4IQ09_9SPHI|nr:hypothetical protein [Mucilaginibacter aquatilis]MVN90933.1 hypothetical protein [Mucilaginibacter aquatilis]
MSHHEEDKSNDQYYYIVALLAGLFVGFIVDRGAIYIPIGGILGLLTAALFIKFLVRGRHDV